MQDKQLNRHLNLIELILDREMYSEEIYVLRMKHSTMRSK